MKTLSGIALAAALVAAGCGGTSTGTELSNATPDVEGLTLELTGSAAESAQASGNAAFDVSLQDLTVGPEYLAQTREAIQAVNAAIKKLVEPIVALAHTTGVDSAGNVTRYGPQDSTGATYLLTVKKAGNNYFWKLDAKALGAADSTYQVVAAGHIKRKLVKDAAGDADVAHRGRGVIGFNLDALGAIDASFKGRGKIFSAFAHHGGSKMVLHRLHAFTSDPATVPALTAAFYGHKTASGEARVRVGGFFDVLDGPAGKELLLARAHVVPGVGGRADVRLPAVTPQGASNGDVPAGRFIVGHACWDAAEKEGFKVVLSCEAGKPASAATCTVLQTSGARANCKPGTDQDEEAHGDLEDVSTEPGAPGAFDDAAPGSMPEF